MELHNFVQFETKSGNLSLISVWFSVSEADVRLLRRFLPRDVCASWTLGVVEKGQGPGRGAPLSSLSFTPCADLDWRRGLWRLG